MLSIGNFVTPDLLGGGKRTMLGNLIYDQFLTARDWPFGSAIAAIVIVHHDGCSSPSRRSWSTAAIGEERA